jgi:hypothetical protein
MSIAMTTRSKPMTKIKLGRALVILFSVALISRGTMGAVKPSDEGDGTKFSGKTVEMKGKSEFAVLLSFPAGKEVTATTDGEQNTDIHLFVYDSGKKEVGKDTSPGPKCEIKFTPAKQGKFKLLVKNLGGPNKVTLSVKVAE